MLSSPEGTAETARPHRPSLRDVGQFCGAPGVETPGYCRKFLRNKPNQRLKKVLGYRFKYPTFRQGYSEEIHC